MSKSEEIHWYPMRVTYSRELMAKAFLDEIGIECFIPMRYEHIEGKHPRHQVLKPAINNLIFVHSSQKSITELKMTKREMSYLRYMMHPILDDKNSIIRHEILTVPDQQMDNFMKVASVLDNRVFYVENLAFAGRPGQRVKVMEGDNVVAQYEVDYHWTEKNISVKSDSLSVRLYNRMKGFIDCEVKLNTDEIQKIPNK